MKRLSVLSTAAGIAGIVLFAASLRVLGAGRIAEGLGRVGWAFAAILVLAGLREAVRAFAWVLTVDGSGLRFLPAFRARLAGEALNALLPMGMVVGEPTKAAHVRHSLPLPAAFRSLAIEFAFYTASLGALFAAGITTFLIRSRVMPAFGWLALVALGVVVAAMATRTSAIQRVREELVDFAAARPGHVRTILALELAYHALGVAEVYLILRLVSPFPPTVASAIALETVSRAVTMLFKMLPMRVGVDEVGSSLSAARFGLDPAAGLTVALVRKLRLLFWSAVGLLMLLLGAPVAAQQGAGVAGNVSIPGPDGQPVLVPGVTLTLACPAAEPQIAISDDRGDFRFDLVATGQGACSLVAELQGFTSSVKTVAPVAGAETRVELQLGLNTLREEVTVAAKADAVGDLPSSATVERMTAPLMRTAPIASDRFQDALPLIPGVVRGPDGLLKINGSRSSQSALTFNDANATDPVTGEDAIELPIDAVQSVQVRGAAYAPEFGLSSGAMTSVETQRAGDAWDFTLNDLEPRLRRRGGEFRGIESWTPRVTVGGPIAKGTLNLLQSMQYEYSQTQVFGLPPLQSDTKVQSFESFTRADWAAAQTNHVTASAAVSPRKTTYAGLNTFNPQPVTPDVKSHNVLGSVSDQAIIGDRGVLDTRVSVKQFDSTIYPSTGSAPMVLAPDVNAGSYFNSQDRTSRRIEGFSSYSFTPFGPAHLIKVGAGVTHESFDGVSTNGPIHIVRENGTLSQLIAFAGAGRIGRSKTAIQGYAQDSWTAASRLTVQYGVRYDDESIAGGVNVAPRVSFTGVVTPDGRTVVRGGAGVFYSAVPLNVASFDQMQTRVVTMFDEDGRAPLGPGVKLTNSMSGELRVPRSVNANIEIDREWLKNLFVRVGYQQRESRFDPVVDATPTAILLGTDGRSRYREAQITARYQFRDGDQIVGSYTRSSAIGNLNDFNGFFGNIENPVIRPDARGPLPWDAPNRFLFWASASLPWGFAVFPVLDVRTGFPLSNVDGDRNFVGVRNEGRYPRFVSIDAQVTKKLRLFNHDATIGLKVFNITNHFNPRDYQGNLASAAFGHFDNSVGRTFRGKWIFEF